ncbi:hypothetical protein ACFE04_014223 [Oxalis oulophora]
MLHTFQQHNTKRQHANQGRGSISSLGGKYSNQNVTALSRFRDLSRKLIINIRTISGGILTAGRNTYSPQAQSIKAAQPHALNVSRLFFCIVTYLQQHYWIRVSCQYACYKELSLYVNKLFVGEHHPFQLVSKEISKGRPQTSDDRDRLRTSSSRWTVGGCD